MSKTSPVANPSPPPPPAPENCTPGAKVKLPTYDAVGIAHVGFFGQREFWARNADQQAWVKIDADTAAQLQSRDLQEWSSDEVREEGWHVVKQGQPVETPKMQLHARMAEVDTVQRQVVAEASRLNELEHAEPRDESAIADAKTSLNNTLYKAFMTLSDADRASKAYFESEKSDHAGKLGGATAEAEARTESSLSATRAYFADVRKFANGKLNFAAVEPSDLRAALVKASHYCDGRYLMDEQGKQIGLITQVNGDHVDNPTDLLAKLGNVPPGKEIEFTVLKDGSPIKVKHVISNEKSTAEADQAQKPIHRSQQHKPAHPSPLHKPHPSPQYKPIHQSHIGKGGNPI